MNSISFALCRHWGALSNDLLQQTQFPVSPRYSTARGYARCLTQQVRSSRCDMCACLLQQVHLATRWKTGIPDRMMQQAACSRGRPSGGTPGAGRGVSLGALQVPAVSACAPPRRRPSACLQPAASASTRSSASQAADVHDTPSHPKSMYAYVRSQLKHSMAAHEGQLTASALLASSRPPRHAPGPAAGPAAVVLGQLKLPK